MQMVRSGEGISIIDLIRNFFYAGVTEIGV